MVGGAFSLESAERTLEYLAALLYLFRQPLMVKADGSASGV